MASILCRGAPDPEPDRNLSHCESIIVALIDSLRRQSKLVTVHSRDYVLKESKQRFVSAHRRRITFPQPIV
jgi:hypothetical protein